MNRLSSYEQFSNTIQNDNVKTPPQDMQKAHLHSHDTILMTNDEIR